VKLRKIFGYKREEITGSGEDYIRRSFVICTSHQILFG
jgi:late competence protein required for DNA uptake (superfamily II DNA/RNA helicase)